MTTAEEMNDLIKKIRTHSIEVLKELDVLTVQEGKLVMTRNRNKLEEALKKLKEETKNGKR